MEHEGDMWQFGNVFKDIIPDAFGNLFTDGSLEFVSQGMLNHFLDY